VSSLRPHKIPIVDLRAQYAKIRDEVRKAIDEVADSQQFILGPAVKRFEEQMAEYLQCDFAIGVASGSDALLLSLMALGVGPGEPCRNFLALAKKYQFQIVEDVAQACGARMRIGRTSQICRNDRRTRLFLVFPEQDSGRIW
jgi:dTDP-4-amino-4,6-dideoxygalactose transaminase